MRFLHLLRHGHWPDWRTVRMPTWPHRVMWHWCQTCERKRGYPGPAAWR